MALAVTYTFVAGTTIQAAQANQNFDDVENYVNANLELKSDHASDIALLPKGKMGYASVTADQTPITTVVDLTSLTLTFTAVASRFYRITGYCNAQSTVATDRIDLQITDSTPTQLQLFAGAPNAANQAIGMLAQVVVQPGAGSKTYKLRMARGVGTGTITMKAAATFPAFILIEDIGL